jgi:hypothetical protein
MNETVMFAGALVGTWLLLLWQRAPATTLFFSLLVGQILSTEVSGEVYSIVSERTDVNEYQYVQLGLLIAPVLLTLLFLRHKVHRSNSIIEAIPMLFVVSALAIFAYPHVPQIQNVLEEVTDHKVETYKNIIITVASLSSLVSAWFSYPHMGKRRLTKKHD